MIIRGSAGSQYENHFAIKTLLTSPEGVLNSTIKIKKC